MRQDPDQRYIRWRSLWHRIRHFGPLGLGNRTECGCAIYPPYTVRPSVPEGEPLCPECFRPERAGPSEH